MGGEWCRRSAPAGREKAKCLLLSLRLPASLPASLPSPPPPLPSVVALPFLPSQHICHVTEKATGGASSRKPCSQASPGIRAGHGVA